MAAATIFSTQMTAITGNTGGGIQSLPNVTAVNGTKKNFHADITFASQVAGTTIGIARLPLGAMITGIQILTDTSTGSTTLSIGDSNSAALYAAAAAYTTTNAPQRVGLAATMGVPITSGYDCVTNTASKSYEDIVVVTAAATAPASGNLRIDIEYVID